ncbi:unnamed protein product, partial [Scytosiphon promiscuus]
DHQRVEGNRDAALTPFPHGSRRSPRRPHLRQPVLGMTVRWRPPTRVIGLSMVSELFSSDRPGGLGSYVRIPRLLFNVVCRKDSNEPAQLQLSLSDLLSTALHTPETVRIPRPQSTPPPTFARARSRGQP